MTTVPVNKRKRDWFRILRTLKAHGISMAQIAAVTGRNSGAVKHWQNGGEPKESDARIVLALLAKMAPEAYAQDQAEFGIRAEVANISQAGDQDRLAFVEVK
jgi:transcriptional regulator with XRE-family HTH domain